MYIEKNICESIVETLLEIKGKNKDGLNTHLDLVDLDIMRKLQPSSSGELSRGKWHLSLEKKRQLCRFLNDIKMSDNYASNISLYVNLQDGTLSNLKSHDCHVLLECLLSLAMRGVVADTA